MVHCIHQWDYKFKIFKFLQSPKKVFILTNSENPDEMLHYAAFHLGLHYLPKYFLGGLNMKCCIVGNFIWVFTICQSTSLDDSTIHKGNEVVDTLQVV